MNEDKNVYGDIFNNSFIKEVIISVKQDTPFLALRVHRHVGQHVPCHVEHLAHQNEVLKKSKPIKNCGDVSQHVNKCILICVWCSSMFLMFDKITHTHVPPCHVSRFVSCVPISCELGYKQYGNPLKLWLSGFQVSRQSLEQATCSSSELKSSMVTSSPVVVLFFK